MRVQMPVMMVLSLLFCLPPAMAADAPPPSDMEAFFKMDPVSEQENGFYALIGLAAPASITDIWAYGHDPKTRAAVPVLSIATRDGRKPREALACFVEQRPAAGQPCVSDAEAEKLIADNALLLARYERLLQYPRFVDEAGVWANGSLIINLSGVKLAQIGLQAKKGAGQAALDEWKRYTRYWQRAIADRQTMVGKSIVLVLYKQHLSSLPVILAADPALARANEQALLDILSAPPFGDGGWNIADTFRMDFALIQAGGGTIDGKPLDMQAIQHLTYELAQDTLAVAALPPKAMPDSIRRVEEKYDYVGRPATEIANHFPEKLVVGGMAIGVDLLLAQQRREVYARMLRLYVMAKAKEQTPDGMPAFLAAASPELQNPFAESPFGWDDAERAIYFESAHYTPKGETKSKEAVFY